MAWNKVFSNPNIQALRVKFPTMRGRAIAALDGVDHHLSEAQGSLLVIYDDPEARRIYNDIYDRLEQLRRHVRKVAEFKKPRQL